MTFYRTPFDVYADPAKFFSNTHPAQNLKDVAKAVFSRLSNPAEPGLTLRLSTGFGGGKTHALMTLWHLGRNSSSALGAELLENTTRPAKVTTIAVDCGKAGVPDFDTHPDASPKSLWGSFSISLGNPNPPAAGRQRLLPLEALMPLRPLPMKSRLRPCFPTVPFSFCWMNS